MAKFDLKGLLNDRSVPDRQQEQKIVYRNPEDLIPSEENFYNTEKLEKLKQSIKLLGILQPLLIENRDGKDYVIAGHCRRKCCIDLIHEGNEKFNQIPCMYKTTSELEQDAGQEDEILRQIMIIQANCYRDKTDWEKMTETLRMESLVKELREKTKMEGKTRDILKDLIGTSNGQIARYHAISTNLCDPLMEAFEEDKIKISAAYDASTLDVEYQSRAYEIYKDTGTLSLEDIRSLKRQQEAGKQIPGQESITTHSEYMPGKMTIETATGQNHPPEDRTEIPAETQIERFYESLNKNMKNYIIQEDKNMTIFMLSELYRSARVRNGHLNYQGSVDCITFNPGGVFERELTWADLAKNLIGKYGHKKPVKILPVDAPEQLTVTEAVKSFCEAYPKKLKTIMRICRQYQSNGEAAKAIQKEMAPYGWSSHSGSDVDWEFYGFAKGLKITVEKETVNMKYGRLVAEVKNLYDPYSTEFDEETDKGPAKCIAGKSGSGICGAAAYCDMKYNCCSQCQEDCNSRCGWIPERCFQAADQEENAAEKQQTDHFVEPNKIDHTGETTGMPWPEELIDIQIPTETEITGYLYDEQRKLEQIEEAKRTWMEVYRQQLIVAGLRLIKKMVER